MALKLKIGRLCYETRAAIYDGPILVEKFTSVSAARKRYKELKSKFTTADGKRHCKKCDQWLPVEDFQLRKKKSECDICVKLRMRKYHKENKEEIRKRSRQYYMMKKRREQRQIERNLIILEKQKEILPKGDIKWSKC